MTGKPQGAWLTRGVGARLAVAMAVSALVWLGFFWATGSGISL